MKNSMNRPLKDRMIHIRLDDQTHKKLKIEAARNDTTIRRLVEEISH
jgi:plasmid stability protein